MHERRTQASLLACVFYYTIKAEREVKAWTITLTPIWRDIRACKPLKCSGDKLQGDSEFLRTASGKDSVKVFAVMDELMGAVGAINKNLYAATIEKLKEI